MVYTLETQNYRIANTDKTVCSMQELYHSKLSSWKDQGLMGIQSLDAS